MAVKCPNCGSAVKDEGKFCSYCGAKLPDDTKRVEVKIDNTAEIKRAEYEEQESKLRQKKMERELRKEQRKPLVVILKILSFVVPLWLSFGGIVQGMAQLLCYVVGLLFFIVWMLLFLHKI